MLDPTATLAINDWLINLRAAAGSEFKLLFMTRPQLVEKFRIDKGKPYSAYPDFDSIAGGGFSAWRAARTPWVSFRKCSTDGSSTT